MSDSQRFLDSRPYQSVRATPTSRADRYRFGKELRDNVPVSELGIWRADPSRPDPISLIESSHLGRKSDLIPIRVARMISSPYGFLRGAAVVQAFDNAHLPATGIQPVICGDAHLGNFGFYRSPEGEQVIDLNDFDEAHTGGWEWDLRRLTAAIHVAGRENNITEAECAQAVLKCVQAYRDEVRKLSEMSLLDRAFNRLDLKKLQQSADSDDLQAEIKRAGKHAKKRTSDRAVPKFTETTREGELQITEEPPLIRRVSASKFHKIGAALDEYLTTLPSQWARLVAGYTLVDVAHKVVGVGSVGLRAYVALLVGANSSDVLFLQMKQARRSVLAQYVHGDRVWHAHQGQRVVEYQQALQTVSDPLLGWTTVDNNQYYVRQFRNMKGTVPLGNLKAVALSDYAGIVGHLLAKGHARTRGASMIAGYLGDSDEAALALARYARHYADQTEADHDALVKAVKIGRLPCAEDAVMASAFRPGS